jgi:hypothetical protein
MLTWSKRGWLSVDEKELPSITILRIKRAASPVTKCPVIVDSQTCGLNIIEEQTDDPIPLLVYRCSLSHRSYDKKADPSSPLFKISSAEFRRTGSDDMYHFCASCSHWPIDAYVAWVEVPGDYAVCKECIVEYERGFLASLRNASLNTSRAFSQLRRLISINAVAFLGQLASAISFLQISS